MGFFIYKRFNIINYSAEYFKFLNAIDGTTLLSINNFELLPIAIISLNKVREAKS